VLKEGKLTKATKATGENACIVLKYPKGTKKLSIRYGISFIDEKQAASNLQREVADKTILELQENARQIWNDALSKIEVDGTNESDKKVFYTSLYRTYERPVSLSEDGRYYSAFDGKVHKDNGRSFYTDDWIWDSYRAHHPLRVLIDPEKEEDIIHSFITMAEQMDNFWMPTFPEVTGDSRRMNSNHGVASVIDAYRKGLSNFDLEKAYQAAKGGITEKTLAPWSGMPAGIIDQFYKEKGYFPALPDGAEETVPEVHSFESRQPVAVTLGTSYDEWCLAQIAKELGKEKEYQHFLANSLNYRNLFNSETEFFHPKDDKGNFIEPFDYKFSGGMGARKFYGENNAWTYRWDVQHNIEDLINLMGGREDFIENLDALFSEPLGRSKYAFYAQLPDQTGNVGQFSMANEPSLHIPYLYNYAGQPWKTQKRIRTLLHQWFRNDLMGVPGDEDGGGMTAFVVFSQLGFYPVTPGTPIYNIGSPVFENAVVHLGDDKTFKITTTNYAPENKYIQSAKLNGKKWNKAWFSHEDIANGGTLELVMGNKANKDWGKEKAMAPPMIQ
jgi:predicted alpha-1,2-mannosidase